MQARDSVFGKRGRHGASEETEAPKLVGSHEAKHDEHMFAKQHQHAEHNPHHSAPSHTHYKEKYMDGAPHVHIDNREDSPAMIPGMYGHDGCGFGGGLGAGLVGGILGGALFGGGFGRGFGGHWGGDCGGGAASKADLAIDLRDSIVSDIQRQNIDRDVLESKYALSLGQANTNSKIDMCCCATQKEILTTGFANQLAWKQNELDMFKMKCDLSGQIGALTCITKDGFKDLCCEIKQMANAVNNNTAKQTIAGILSAVTLTEGQELGINVALNSINSKVGCCC